MTKAMPSTRFGLYRPWLVLILAALTGCATVAPTRPNSPFQGPYPQSVEKLRKENSLLATELGKLPDIQDGITAPEAEALERLAETYSANPDIFDAAFDIMYQVGIPEVRKYCTLLEACFWYALQNDSQALRWYLAFYRRGATDPEDPFLEMTRINSLLSRVWDFSDAGQWQDPATVMQRLNAPELVEYWFERQFIYDWGKFRMPPPMYGQSAAKTIRTRKGVCYDAANFARECLLTGGYKATGLNILLSPGGRVRGHSVCVVSMDLPSGTRFYKFADTRYLHRAIGVPYDSYRSMAEAMAREYGQHLKRYNVGRPAFLR